MYTMKICLDAGHYGKYNQSPANPQYWESDFTWKFHFLLKSELEKHGIEVITTRKEQNKDLGLEQRGMLSEGCDLFLSIHSNACSTESVDYPLACCCVDGTADVLGHELAETVGKIMQTTGKPNIIKKKQGDGRDWYGVLRGAASVGTPAILLEHSFHTNRRATEWLMNAENLRRMAEAEAETIAKYFDVRLIRPETADNTTDSTARKIWGKLRSAGLSEAGAAGLMGNLKAESNLDPQNLQNTYERKLGFTDATYTAAVDAGTYNNFANDAAGYGLAQWTYHTRKAALLDFAKEHGKSVGNLDLQIDFLLQELIDSYPVLFGELRTATNVRTASNAVLTQFERPADMSESVKQKRAAFGETFLEKFGGNTDAEQPVVQITEDTVNVTMTVNGKQYSGVLTKI